MFKSLTNQESEMQHNQTAHLNLNTAKVNIETYPPHLTETVMGNQDEGTGGGLRSVTV